MGEHDCCGYMAGISLILVAWPTHIGLAGIILLYFGAWACSCGSDVYLGSCSATYRGW